MPERVCREQFEYPPGSLRKPGDRFEVEPDHVNVLTVLGKIEPDASTESVEAVDSGEEISGTLHAPRRGRPRKVV